MIDGWTKPGEAAAWRIDVVEAGDYEVTLIYGCDPADAGGEFRIEVGDAHLQGKVEGTVERDVFETRRIGVFKLRKGSAALKVKVVSVPGRELMALNRILLRRIEV